MRYRINFGNGQVDYPGSLKECKRVLPLCGGYAYIQFRDNQTGDWFNIKFLGK